MRNICVILILLVLDIPDSPGQDAALDWKRLNSGDVIVEEVATESGIPGVRALFIVKASRESIWSTLVDYDNFSKIFDGIDHLQVLEQNQDGARVEFWVDAVVANLHYVLYRHYDKPGYRITWKRESGDLKKIQGNWKIMDTPDPGKKLLIYESYVDIGFSLITWAIRQGAKSRAAKMGRRLRNWIDNERNE
jgi:hypothetical protein